MPEVPGTKAKCTMIPLGNRVIVETDEPKKSYGSTKIIIPEKAQRRPSTGVIVAVGNVDDTVFCPFCREACETEGCDLLHQGDRIVFGQFSGTLVQIAGKPAYTILTVDEILARIEKEAELDYTAAG